MLWSTSGVMPKVRREVTRRALAAGGGGGGTVVGGVLLRSRAQIEQLPPVEVEGRELADIQAELTRILDAR